MNDQEQAIRVVHGDCGVILPTVPCHSIGAIVTDPPFGVGFHSNETSYDDSKDSVLPLIPGWFREWHRVLKDDSYLFLFCGIKNIENWIAEGKKAGFTFKNLIATRSFNNGAACSMKNFAFVMQPVLLFSKGNGRKFHEVNLFPTSKEWLEDHRNTNPKPFTYLYPNFIPTDVTYGTEVFSNGADTKRVVHPNAKNVKLIEFFIEIATDAGETVLDPFCGGGSTGVAAMFAERRFIGIEKDEKFYKSALKRIENTMTLFHQDGGAV